MFDSIEIDTLGICAYTCKVYEPLQDAWRAFMAVAICESMEISGAEALAMQLMEIRLPSLNRLTLHLTEAQEPYFHSVLHMSIRLAMAVDMPAEFALSCFLGETYKIWHYAVYPDRLKKSELMGQYWMHMLQQLDPDEVVDEVFAEYGEMFRASLEEMLAEPGEVTGYSAAG